MEDRSKEVAHSGYWLDGSIYVVGRWLKLNIGQEYSAITQLFWVGIFQNKADLRYKNFKSAAPTQFSRYIQNGFKQAYHKLKNRVDTFWYFKLYQVENIALLRRFL